MSSGYLVPSASRGLVLLPGSCITEPGTLCLMYLLTFAGLVSGKLLSCLILWTDELETFCVIEVTFDSRSLAGCMRLWGINTECNYHPHWWERGVVLHPCPHLGGNSRANIGHSSTAGGSAFGIQVWNPAKCFLRGLRCRVAVSWYTALLWYCCLCAFHVCCESRSEQKAILVQQIVVSGNFSFKAFPLRIHL